MSGPEALLLEAARRDTRTPTTTQILEYAESEGAEPGALFEPPPRAGSPADGVPKPPAHPPDGTTGRAVGFHLFARRGRTRRGRGSFS